MKKVVRSNVTLWLAVASLVFFALLPMVARSSLFIRPVSVVFEGGDLLLVRELPFGPVMARWHDEIFVPALGIECEASGENLYDERPFNTARFPVPRSMVRCLDAPGVKVMTSEWRVILWGWIPLRPVTMTQTFGDEVTG